MSSYETITTPLRFEPYRGEDDLRAHWNRADLLVLPSDRPGPYLTGFASSDRCVELALRLRYEVFNLELGEGLTESVKTGLDRDDFDEQMIHLVLLDHQSNSVVGTYRLQTVSHALEHAGLYSARQYDLTDFEPYFPKAVEAGRACLAREHRVMRAILKLWLGIGTYMNRFDQWYLFGCSSLTTNDPDDGWRALKTIRANGHLHNDLMLPALPRFSCGLSAREFDPELGEAILLPKLFRTYLRLGGQVISEPSVDPEFGTVDFLTMIDGREVAFSALDVLK